MSEATDDAGKAGDDEKAGKPAPKAKAGGKSGRLGSMMSKPVGPLPLGAWIVVIIAGVGIGYLLRQRGGGGSSARASSTTDDAPYPYPGGSGRVIGSGSTNNGGSGAADPLTALPALPALPADPWIPEPIPRGDNGGSGKVYRTMPVTFGPVAAAPPAAPPAATMAPTELPGPFSAYNFGERNITADTAASLQSGWAKNQGDTAAGDYYHGRARTAAQRDRWANEYSATHGGLVWVG